MFDFLSPRQMQRAISLANSSVATHTPLYSLWPFNCPTDGKGKPIPVGPWQPGSQPDVVSRTRHEIRKWSKSNRDSVGRKIEKFYLNRFFPRNFKNGEVMWDVLGSINYRPSTPCNVKLTDVYLVLRLLNFSQHTFDIRKAIATVYPTSTQASLGLTYLPSRNHMIMGDKGPQWWSVVSEALKVYDNLKAKYGSLSFDEIVRRKKEIIEALKLVFVAFARWDDGGPNNPRLIWAGNSIMYILETAVFSDISKQFHNSPYFTYTERDVWTYLRQNSPPYLMMDLSKFDRHFTSSFQKVIWKAICNYFKLPEWLMGILYVYNAFSPLVVPSLNENLKKTFAIQQVDGINRSGSGSFVYINNIGNHVLQNLTLKYFGKLGLAHLYGDNTLISLYDTSLETKPPLRVVSEWAAYLCTKFGFKMKLPESVVGSKCVVQTRRIFDTVNGVTEPVVASRIRNLLCPKAFDPRSLSSPEIAVRIRAQTIEIILAHQHTKRYKVILDLVDRLGLLDRTLPELSDAELASFLPHSSRSAQSLERVKQFRDIGDYSDILTSHT